MLSKLEYLALTLCAVKVEVNVKESMISENFEDNVDSNIDEQLEILSCFTVYSNFWNIHNEVCSIPRTTNIRDLHLKGQIFMGADCFPITSHYKNF